MGLGCVSVHLLIPCAQGWAASRSQPLARSPERLRLPLCLGLCVPNVLLVF